MAGLLLFCLFLAMPSVCDKHTRRILMNNNTRQISKKGVLGLIADLSGIGLRLGSPAYPQIHSRSVRLRPSAAGL